MPRYRIYHLKESQRQRFRQAPPGESPLQLKKKDYQPGGEIEASSPYAAWKLLQQPGEGSIGVGDALETDSGALLVCKYAGFEEAQWFVPPPEATPAESAGSPPEDPLTVTPAAEQPPSR